MKRMAVVLTLVVALVLSGVASTSAAKKAGGNNGKVHTNGPILPGGSWGED